MIAKKHMKCEGVRSGTRPEELDVRATEGSRLEYGAARLEIRLKLIGGLIYRNAKRPKVRVRITNQLDRGAAVNLALGSE